MFEIKVVNQPRRFQVELYQDGNKIKESGYQGVWFIHEGERYLLTGGDFYEPVLRCSTLYKLEPVCTEKGEI
jgi:hypothetical protein